MTSELLAIAMVQPSKCRDVSRQTDKQNLQSEALRKVC